MLINALVQMAQGSHTSEDSAIFIRCELLCLDDLCLEGFEILVVEAEPYLEGWVGNSPLPFQEGDDLIENVVKCHDLLPAQPCSPFVNFLHQCRLQKGRAQ